MPARSHRRAPAFEFHKAQAAAAEWMQLRMIAQGGNLHPGFFCRPENGGSFRDFNLSAVNGEFD
jgi:hypothetical protein